MHSFGSAFSHSTFGLRLAMLLHVATDFSPCGSKVFPWSFSTPSVKSEAQDGEGKFGCISQPAWTLLWELAE
jgi:hypothetical protein